MRRGSPCPGPSGDPCPRAAVTPLRCDSDLYVLDLLGLITAVAGVGWEGALPWPRAWWEILRVGWAWSPERLALGWGTAQSALGEHLLPAISMP